MVKYSKKYDFINKNNDSQYNLLNLAIDFIIPSCLHYRKFEWIP